MKESRERFFVVAIWDEEAGVYYSRSNIDGLHIEADTIDEFEQSVDDCAAELILNNHFTAEEHLTRELASMSFNRRRLDPLCQTAYIMG